MDIGDQAILQAIFKDREGVLTDPTTVAFYVMKPGDAAGTVVSGAKVSDGIWEALYTITASGLHWWRVEGTGAVTAAEERSFEVSDRRVPHA